MKVTSPSQLSSPISNVEEVISKFEKQLKKEEVGRRFYFLVIKGEYPRSICDEVEKIYTNAGWVNVKCFTSSENGEWPGLTSIQMWVD